MSPQQAGNGALPRWLWPRAAYLHIPFCAHHCGYCDFAIAVGQDSLIDAYLDALLEELARLETPQFVETIFLGGGTPSHLDCRQLERLLNGIRHWLPGTDDLEFSIEANPDSLPDDKIALLADHGVTRISLGVQSFQRPVLEVLERLHTPEQVPHVIEAIQARIPVLSLDLIFGVPGQTVDHWRDDLRQALSLGPDHLSTYGLTFEKGTPLWKRRERGLVASLEEDQELRLYSETIDLLESAGFEHYEISSFARPGRRCRHNQVYWANEAYFGFGMGAARYVQGRRELNSRDLKTYIQRITSGQPATFQSEVLPPRPAAFETMSLNLRRREGIDRAGFHERTGFTVEELAGAEIERLRSQGLLQDAEGRVFLTRQGKYVADAVIEELLRPCEAEESAESSPPMSLPLTASPRRGE